MDSELLINLNTFDRVKNFIDIANKFSSDIDVRRDNYIVDGKSMVGIFTLDLAKPITIKINSRDKEEIAKFHEEMKKFI